MTILAADTEHPRDFLGYGANPPDLVELAALPVREGRPDTSISTPRA